MWVNLTLDFLREHINIDTRIRVIGSNDEVRLNYFTYEGIVYITNIYDSNIRGWFYYNNLQYEILQS